MLPQSQPLALSLTALILVNMIPLIGVIAWDWNVLDLMILFWAENVIIGLINVLRMGTLLFLRQAYGALFMIPFFTLHYGAFCAGHGVAILTILGPDTGVGTPISELISVMSQHLSVLALPIAAMGASHLVSFIVNFLIGREFDHATMESFTGTVYNRVVVLHVAILFGGFVTQALGGPLFALVLLVVIKTWIDARAHIREHTALQASQSDG